MTTEQMRRAMSVEAQAEKLRRQFDKFVLLQKDGASRPEEINVGDPVQYKQGEYHRVQVPIPESARRHVFHLWRKEIALQYNELVRELAQLGVTTELRLIEFSAATGLPA